MPNITSLQIGQNKIELELTPDYSEHTHLPNNFILAKRDMNPVLTDAKDIDFYVATYTATEDCFVRFEGVTTNTENRYYVYDDDNKYFIHSIGLGSSYPNNTEFYDNCIFMKANSTYEWWVRGFTKARLVKFKVK